MPKKTEITTTKNEITRPARKLAWGGVMPKPQSQDPAPVEFCNKVAEVYGVPSMGVNAMGNQPYLNKDGRLYLLNELRKGQRAVKAIRKDFIQYSTDANTPAIIKATIVFKDGVEIEAIGEASKENVKLSAVKTTLNLMAETRAVNRAIWQAIAGDVWNRVATNLAKSNMSEEEKARIAEAGRSSYEEMGRPEKTGGSKEDKIIEKLIAMIDGASDVSTLSEYKDKLEMNDASDRVKQEVGARITERIKQLENA